jgi:hypothetical protein
MEDPNELSYNQRCVLYTQRSRQKKKEENVREFLKDCQTVEDVIKLLVSKKKSIHFQKE